VSAHTFEPSPSTIVSLLSGDIIIYTDGELEPWVTNMLESEDFDNANTLKLSDFVTLLDHEEDHDEEVHDDHDEEDEHDHEYDPHFWSDPNNMILITEAIEEELVAMYPDSESIIRDNADEYIAQMQEVDQLYLDWEEHRTSDFLMHGGHNSIGYMVEAYHVEYVNPYEGFSTDAEPTAQAIAYMLDLMNTNGIEYLFSEKLLSQTVANTIVEETGATVLYIYSMGNVSPEDYEEGITVYDMMIHNLEQYKIGLGYVTD
jgi:zinc transport system substrate-binding protein